jgi:hypothetical protein
LHLARQVHCEAAKGRKFIMRYTSWFLLFFTACGLVLAQTTPPGGGWRRVDDPPPLAQDPTQPVDRSDAQQVRPPYGVIPNELTINTGTFITIRTNQMLSSNQNQPGDPFSGTLVQPLVVDGIVLANRSQEVYGRVVEAQKARSNSPSRLGLELTSITLADGSQVPVRTQLVTRHGTTTPVGEQIDTVATTTTVGAVVGAAADWGRGAAIGAAVGAAAGLAGVMVTRNQPTVVYPETPLTFRMEAPLVVNTTRAPHAFRWVDPNDYERVEPARLEPRPPPRRMPVVVAPYPYPYPYYWGGGIAIGWGHHVYRGRGWHRGWWW